MNLKRPPPGLPPQAGGGTLRTVSQRGAALFLGGVFVAALIGGALVAWWVFANVDLRLVLANQPAKLTIDQPLRVEARALDNLQISLNDTIRTKVPVNQEITVPVKQTLNVIADFDGEVPIRMDVDVDEKITIDQVLDVDAVLDAEILGDKLKLPVRGRIPVKADVPVRLTIPVDKRVRLKLHAPVGVKVKEDLRVPLQTVIDAEIPIASDLSVPVRAAFPAEVEFAKEPFDATIVEADLRLPLRTLRLERKPGEPAK